MLRVRETHHFSSFAGAGQGRRAGPYHPSHFLMSLLGTM